MTRKRKTQLETDNENNKRIVAHEVLNKMLKVDVDTAIKRGDAIHVKSVVSAMIDAMDVYAERYCYYLWPGDR